MRYRDAEEEVCGTCRYNKRKVLGNGDYEFVCSNDESDAYGLATDYNDTCPGWEEKD